MSGGKYRFTVNTRVLCKTGADEWSAGTIVKLDYTEPQFQGRVMPYQVQLDASSGGNLIFVPADIVQLCKLLVPPWWEKAFIMPSSFYRSEDSGKIISQAYEKAETKNVNQVDHEGTTALMAAARFNWEFGVAELLKLNADVNLITAKKRHALHYSAECSEAVTKLLIDAKADLNCQEDDPDFDPEFTSTTFGDRLTHRTPLHTAVAAGNAATALLLLNGGADINVQDAQYKTALHLAIEEKNDEMIELLIRHKANVNMGNQESGMNNSPLMDAAHVGDLHLIQMLLPARADVNQQGKQEMSAMHLAARKGEAKIVEILLEARADVNQKSQCGTVEQLARKNGSKEMLKVLGLATDDDKGYGTSNLEALTAAQRAELFLE